MSEIKSIDFEIIKEPWNKYQISDNSILKTRTILMKVLRKMNRDKPDFRIDAQTLTIVNADPSLNGSPDTKQHSPEDISRAIDKDDM